MIEWMPAANRLLAMEEGDLEECERIVRSRKTAVNVAKRAQMLVLAAGGLSNRQIALDLGANDLRATASKSDKTNDFKIGWWIGGSVPATLEL
jgi:hypothetical protein